MVSVYDGDIVKSDSAIPKPLKTALQAAAARLEDVPEFEKDWQPHMDEQVLDLVDPSLFPHNRRELYGLIEQILTRAIPLWNATLGPLRRDKPPKRIEYDCVR